MAVALFGFIVSCVIAKFVLKLGVPKHRPWEKNNDFYMNENSDADRYGSERGSSAHYNSETRRNFNETTKGKDYDETTTVQGHPTSKRM